MRVYLGSSSSLIKFLFPRDLAVTKSRANLSTCTSNGMIILYYYSIFVTKLGTELVFINISFCAQDT